MESLSFYLLLPVYMAPVSTVFLMFFGASLFVLFMIACVKLPDTVRSIRRFIRQMGARKTRSERMLADLEKLSEDARELEGVYRFDSIDPHSSPSQANVGPAVTASLTPSAVLR